MSCRNCLNNELQKNKILIVTDLEGIIGIKSLNDEERNIILYHNELQMLINIVKDFYNEEITICNIHNNNMDKKILSEILLDENRITLLPLEKLPLYINSFQIAFMIGFHGMANSGGIFDHSFRLDIINCQYDTKFIGEVGAFYRYLNNNGVSILFISGEGNFEKELDDIHIEATCIHKVAYDNINMSNEYDRFKNELINAINKKTKKTLMTYEAPFFIKVDNKDKYLILNRTPYHFVSNNNRFIFDTLDIFFKNIISFCTALNYATKIIRDKNYALINKIKKEHKQLMFPDIYKNLPITLIDDQIRS